jgi:endonuclease/exonuclease/phosphatase family metal-dependent hydrolase
VTWARFHHLATGRQIHVYNTHFTLREGPQQLESVARIRERVASLPEGSAVIVMGDFNALAEWSSTWREATSAGLRDAWDVAAERHGPPITSNGFGPPPAEGDSRIDWILIGGPVSVPSVATVVHSANGRYPSDHYPVAATLSIDPS